MTSASAALQVDLHVRKCCYSAMFESQQALARVAIELLLFAHAYYGMVCPLPVDGEIINRD